MEKQIDTETRQKQELIRKMDNPQNYNKSTIEEAKETEEYKKDEQALAKIANIEVDYTEQKQSREDKKNVRKKLIELYEDHKAIYRTAFNLVYKSRDIKREIRHEIETIPNQDLDQIKDLKEKLDDKLEYVAKLKEELHTLDAKYSEMD